MRTFGSSEAVRGRCFAIWSVLLLVVLAAGQQSQAASVPTSGLSASIAVLDVADQGSSVIGVGPGQLVHLHAGAAPAAGTALPSSVSYQWAADAGSFAQGAEGADVIWQAPEVGRSTVRVRASAVLQDVNGNPTGEIDAGATLTADVLHIEEGEIVINNPSVSTAYMYTGQQFNTRAVACVCDTTIWAGGMYCGMAWPSTGWSFDNGAVWSTSPGSALPAPGYPPQSSFFMTPVAAWPGSWTQPTICWCVGFDTTGDPYSDTDYDRQYSYSVTQYLPPAVGQWGENNRAYSVPGQHRLQAEIILGTSAASTTMSKPVDQGGVPLGWEYGTRVFNRDPYAYGVPSPPPGNNAQRESYVQWLSSYNTEPYEWGGSWVGGKDSHGAWAGGGAAYDGYGIDCSGLVANAAYRANYNWISGPYGWRPSTSGLSNTYYTTSTSNPLPGDVYLKPGHHVVSIRAPLYSSGGHLYAQTIEAIGGPPVDGSPPEPRDEVRYHTYCVDTYLSPNGYSAAVLNAH